MQNEQHDLVHEFPEHRASIHDLKMNNKHFAKLFENYHDVEHEVHHIENEGVNTSDDYIESRKVARLRLKDELYQMILKHEAASKA
ncbi:MAG: YdcH family protein [Granulosicoccaceae bacterium]